METRGCLVGRMIIGVIRLLAEASWLYSLTLISQSRPWPHLITPRDRQGAHFHGPLPASSWSVFISHTGFSVFVVLMLSTHLQSLSLSKNWQTALSGSSTSRKWMQRCLFGINLDIGAIKFILSKLGCLFIFVLVQEKLQFWLEKYFVPIVAFC